MTKKQKQFEYAKIQESLKNYKVVERVNYAKIENKLAKKKLDEVHRSQSTDFFGGFGSALLIIFLAVAFISLYRMCVDLPPFTFENLINSFQTCPNVIISNFNNNLIVGDWGVFDFLRGFLNSIASIVYFVLYLVSLLVQAVVFLGHFLTQFFVVPPVSA